MSEEIKNQEAAEAANQDELDQIVSLKKGDTVKGTIVKLEDNQAVVSIGYKYDGVIPIRELSSGLDNAEEAVQVGQEVEARIISIDDGKEKLVLSKRAIDSENAWEKLEQLFESKEVFEVVVNDVVKGGIVVDVGLRGFIPASMVERHFVEDFSDYKGRTLRVVVKELDRENNKVILSQKDVLEAEFEANKLKVMAELKEGQEIVGTVQRLTQFGAFVDVGGVDGLVHVSEIAWTHVDKPSDAVSEGDQVKVKVLKVDPEKGKISLSMKAAQPGPWESAAGQFNNNDIVTGVVKRLVNFGAFVEIAPGVEGLVHISQISHKHIGTPQEVLEEGQEVKVKILEMNPSEKRVSLSIKETEEAPEAAPKAERAPRASRAPREELNNPNVSLNNSGLSITLGERFGDKLNKFK
ncbi:30S ribosomal protein S1 [Paenibacillus polymyxa]|jgi:small subunit ribosomal protein S1|uniref:30S ribosomal protein S1 n=4 Tax=Paenibacillus TaxID=44249 RepID=E3E7Z0_PAEPS|nr:MULTISPECIES: 30S ribosomal protein S1 [Paenibacillus]KAF6636747.1 30S ribosomal protein S1 [Paenibacillus sp. EKM208P]MCF2720056.1 30S ribosomal protein S1 [Paenibacillus sp. UKAQ_18]MCV9948008.1 30S ribosomal protein S1 [Paenibacillus sp. BT-177]ADO57103.1 30S ribosomal protein S1 [Paenibacillus polymyxa SC2]AHM66567.1 RNA binding s1 domain-containing protein [Paenibacillus polymyxa SQR-21]